MSDPTHDKDASALPAMPETVHVIQSSYNYRDVDNYPKTDDEVMEDEGWFASRQAAQDRVDELNQNNVKLWESEQERLRRAHNAKIAVARQHNREAEAIRAAGMRKADVPVPATYVVEPFEAFMRKATSYTGYSVLEISRAETDARPHDGEEQADEVQAEGEASASSAARAEG